MLHGRWPRRYADPAIDGTANRAKTLEFCPNAATAAAERIKTMTPVRLENCFLRAGAVFTEPILSWTSEVPSRFFRALYRSLNNMLYIQPSDFVAPAGVSLGDCSAVLRILGGNSTLTLRANGIIADFPAISPDRIPFANAVIYQGYEAFIAEFKEIEIGSIESNAGYHFAILSDENVLNLLNESVSLLSVQKRTQIAH